VCTQLASFEKDVVTRLSVSTDHFLINFTKNIGLYITGYRCLFYNSAVNNWVRIFSGEFKPHTKKHEVCDSQSYNLWRNGCQN